ncbi:MAG: benzoate-CoA ligase family protein [Gemmatimonadota bacterium]
MSFIPPEQFNIADYFLDARLREGRGDLDAIVTDEGRFTYRDVDRLACRFGNVLRDAGVQPEQRVLLALPDGPAYVGALFGTLKIGAVVVMANPELSRDEIEYFLGYTRSTALVTDADHAPLFAEADRAVRSRGPGYLRATLVLGGELESRLAAASGELETFPTHRDDAAIWLFSGGTTGEPKAVVQTHRSYANSTECYAKAVIEYGEGDRTLSVPKLYFGYATGSNLLFPFAAGGTSILFPEKCTAEALFDRIERHRPTILVNVPTMINRMVSHPEAADRDLSSLRLSTSAGEALPPELHRRWAQTFGVELLDGLGTAEMWHIFLSNRPGDVRPGTLGKAVPGFDVRVCDEDGRELPHGETGWLRVRGNSLAAGYWQRAEETRRAFRGEWYVSGDMVKRDADGYFVYCGRGDDMLKVSGKWLAPGEVENRLLEHPAVREAVVVGVTNEDGLTKPCACVVRADGPGDEPVGEDRTESATATDARAGDGIAAARDGAPARELEAELQAFVRDGLAAYKYPRRILFVDELPRTHLGKVDRGEVRRIVETA